MYKYFLGLTNQAMALTRNKLQSFLEKNESGQLKAFLAKAVAGTFGLQVLNAFFGYVITLLLARFLGASGYGSYTYALTWARLLQLPALLGLLQLLIREISVCQTRGNWGVAQGLFRWANKIVLFSSVGLALLTAFLAGMWNQGSDPNTLFTIWIVMLALPLMTLTSIREASMRALGHILLGQLPELIFRPVLLIVLLCSAYLFFDENLTSPIAMGIYVIATGIAFLIGAKFLQNSLPVELKEASPEYKIKEWMHTALPFLFIGGMYIINNQTDKIMLGAMQGTTSVGLYEVANRGAGLITFILVAFNMSLAPTFASFSTNQERKKLQELVTKSSYIVFIASLPIGLFLILFNHWFLSLFGTEFLAGKVTLIILCTGQLINAFTGSVAVLLNMTGHQNDTAIGVTLSAGINIVLNVILIPQYGSDGAATATAISATIWNVVLVFMVYKRLKIYATPLGGLMKS